MSRRARIIELNDRLRTTFKGGQVRMVPSVHGLDARLCGRALCVMSRWKDFHPRSEHDSGRFAFAGYVFEWSFEYRDIAGRRPSPDPANATRTMRILTLSVIDDLLIPSRKPDTGQHRAAGDTTVRPKSIRP